MYFPGEYLPTPALRFNYSSPSQTHQNARAGLRIYGPYDSSLFGRNSIQVVAVFQKSQRAVAESFLDGFVNGEGAYQPFRATYRVPISIIGRVEFDAETPAELKDACEKVARQDPDLALVLVSGQNDTLYSNVKLDLLRNGIPNQVITTPKVREGSQRQWVLENIALASYAKVGGSPWVASSQSKSRDLIIGVSRAMDSGRKFVVGVVTLFSEEGEFLYSNSVAPTPIEWVQERYVVGLSESILSAFQWYARDIGRPERIVIHLCKRAGQSREVDAAERAMTQIQNPPPYALLHVNDDTNYRLFDSASTTFIPRSGLKVDLRPATSLLLLDGLVQDKRARRGVPRVVEVSLDRRSKVPVDSFDELAHQTHVLSKVNWRGFNALATPTTLAYSYLIARLIVEVGSDRWADIANQARLREKAWFL